MPSGLSKTFWRLSSSTSSSFSFKSPGKGCDVEMGAVTPHCLGCVSAMLATARCCCEGATFSRRRRAEVLRWWAGARNEGCSVSRRVSRQRVEVGRSLIAWSCDVSTGDMSAHTSRRSLELSKCSESMYKSTRASMLLPSLAPASASTPSSHAPRRLTGNDASLATPRRPL